MTDESTEDVEKYVEEPNDLADDVTATLDHLVSMSSAPDNAPFDPSQMYQTFKPQIRMKVFRKPKRALQACALLNRATGDILDKYADEPVEKLAKQALEQSDE